MSNLPCLRRGGLRKGFMEAAFPSARARGGRSRVGSRCADRVCEMIFQCRSL